MQAIESSKLKITPLAAFNDNYIWIIAQDGNQSVYVVDPGDAQVVIDYLDTEQLQLAGILITHHHHDHTGGIAKLLAHAGQQIEVYGPDNENIDNLLNPISTMSSIQCQITLKNFNQKVDVIPLPGHTLGHIGYLMAGELFCGDTLFSGGCGRLFEGTPLQMHDSLMTLSRLPTETRVYCAHEYTLANLDFALSVEPTNPELIQYHELCLNKRSRRIATIPTSIATERNINPFLRCNADTIKASVNQHFMQKASDPVDTFALLRQWKDNF
ncbi:hydroxyacylglutathione hydrolase [Shewanella psychropiezotolerans]|uniref:Hydroxyacylglutathione hydrolase n=1 Tax=Shewanella psychropiezotolerans TaxID=2593655 RepID=A0ABX5WZ54_9GAMM|nr:MULTISPECIES: hydroxyacylglutathione hydrolase [Shewanella]MPY24158.1 hydroxyacylglutathione hydrolase [Shewanella sp. YLB-07]QDO84387.1 hydroxyacylglutathione hydrolase [Shewanella psychropiezotolerans]